MSTQTICRSCGFAAHKPEDLINGQCPRWAAGDICTCPWGDDGHPHSIDCPLVRL